jgi:hypothetical protein
LNQKGGEKKKELNEIKFPLTLNPIGAFNIVQISKSWRNQVILERAE